MANESWSGVTSREIVRRIIVEGSLVLQTPAHFGNGDTGDMVDLPLMVSLHDGKTPLLTGTTIAGALRSNLRAREFGWHAPQPGFEKTAENAPALLKERSSAAVALFGGFCMDDEGKQSPLIIDDAYGELPANGAREVRSGVRIQSDTRTAKKDFLYNAEFWPAGTSFNLRFELLIFKGQDVSTALTLLAAALLGFETGEISLGARRRRGFGRCTVTGWAVRDYFMDQPAGLIGFLEDDLAIQQTGPHIVDLLSARRWVDHRRTLTIRAEFELQDSLMIRSSTGDADSPDFIHLHAHQPNGKKAPVLSGTTLAGVLRARALRISNTLKLANSQLFVDDMFGKQIDTNTDRPSASRVWVDESVIAGAPEMEDGLVQNRVKINRFTGGAHDAALFSEQPVFQQSGTTVTVTIRLAQPQDAQVGLLLYLLKDLWTGDLPVGGESAIGRGRLKGHKATITLTGAGETRICEFTQQGDEPLVFTQGKPTDLDEYQNALREVSHE